MGTGDTASIPRPDVRLAPAVLVLVVPVLAMATGGCTIRADANEVVVEHMADYPGAAQAIADGRCAEFGKTARLVEAGITQKTYLWLRGRVSVFECVDANEVPPRGSGGGGSR